MSIYKKFTAQDYATIPFNAHKQYNFDNFSAASSSVNYFATSWTSESIDFYSAPGSGSEPNTDRINTIKYNQIDHLFYKNFKTDSTHRFGKFNYLKQRRTLYEKANIISIPTGLYGHEIKPSSFYMEGQDTQVQGSAIKLLDDTEGNLIISGTNVNNYPTDVRSNIFNLGPIKGFKAYDLRIFSNYAQVLRDPQGNPWESTKLFYRQGEIDPNIRLDSTYKTPELQIDKDDSYFFNHLKYINVNFQTSSLGSSVCQFPTIKFDSKVGSHIVSPDSEQFDFNPGDDFAVSFQIKVNRPAINPVIGQQYGGGKIFHYDELNEEVYIVHDKVLDNFVKGVPLSDWDGNEANTETPLQNRPWSFIEGNFTDVNGNYFTGAQTSNYNNPSITAVNTALLNGEVPLTTPQTSSINTHNIGSGKTNTDALTELAEQSYSLHNFPMLWWLKNIANDTNSNGLPGNNSISGQNDWWIASFDEIQEIHQKLGDLRRIYFAGEKSYFPSYIDSSPGASVPTHPYLTANSYAINDPNSTPYSPTGTYNNVFGGSPGFFTFNNNSKFPVFQHENGQLTQNLSFYNQDSSPTFRGLTIGPGSQYGFQGIGANTNTCTPVIVTSNYSGVNNNMITVRPNRVAFTQKQFGVNVFNTSTDNVPDHYDTIPGFASFGEGFGVGNVASATINDGNSIPPINYGNLFPNRGQYYSEGLNSYQFPLEVLNAISGRAVAIERQPNSGQLALDLQNTVPFYNFMLIRKQKAINNTTGNIKRYIISKSTTKTITPPSAVSVGAGSILNTRVSGNMQPIDTQAEPQFPFEIYHVSNSIFFERSDGNTLSSVSYELNSTQYWNYNNIPGGSSDIEGPPPHQYKHILCQNSGSNMEIWVRGSKVASTTDKTKLQTQNRANLYIGSKGIRSIKEKEGVSASEIFDFSKTRYFNGELNNINIYNRAFNEVSIQNISESINASPYVGNLFYQQGFGVITHPKYQDLLGGGIGDYVIGNFGNLSFTVGGNLIFRDARGIEKLQFQGSHLIFENEYQCTIEEHEFNSTLNLSARKIKSSLSHELANFTTGSFFKPYITSVGLYNEEGECLVIGKLGQPLKTSNETDTTIVVRWDT